MEEDEGVMMSTRSWGVPDPREEAVHKVRLGAAQSIGTCQGVHTARLVACRKFFKARRNSGFQDIIMQWIDLIPVAEMLVSIHPSIHPLPHTSLAAPADFPRWVG